MPWNVPFGMNTFIIFNGSAPISCNEVTFRSTGQHKICIKSQLFQDPDCAVYLRLNDTKSGQVIHHRLKTQFGLAEKIVRNGRSLRR